MTCAQSRLVDLHFALRIRPPQERELRAHLPDCDACRARYEGQLLLARLDPAAPPIEDRMARGLGVAPPARRRPWVALLTAGVTAAAALILWPQSRFTPRGLRARDSSVVVYRVSPTGASEQVGNAIAPSDELAFAYRNPEGHRYLLVFATDEHRRVYWYYPAWRDAAQDPEAVPIRAGEALVELPEAIGHPLDDGTLTVHSMLLDTPLHVRDVEERLRRGERLPGEETLRVEVRR
jgi:hypothetical protein